MIRSLVRTIMGPSRNPLMTHISRPLPRQLPDEQVVAALEIALARNPDPAYLVETLPAALHEVTGVDYQVLDRTTKDVTGTMGKTQVMIRDGEVGIWPGHRARAYPLLAGPGALQRDRSIVEPEGADAPPPTSPVGKPGWAPPGPVNRPEDG